jgi:hypothetical protein
MNERIEKLGEQADLLGEFTPTNIPGRYVGYITEEQIQKFAELIVQECAYIASHNVMNISTYSDAEFVSDLITQHFGVEE